MGFVLSKEGLSLSNDALQHTAKRGIVLDLWIRKHPVLGLIE